MYDTIPQVIQNPDSHIQGVHEFQELRWEWFPRHYSSVSANLWVWISIDC